MKRISDVQSDYVGIKANLLAGSGVKQFEI
jgi:hypothetical protein